MTSLPDLVCPAGSPPALRQLSTTAPMPSISATRTIPTPATLPASTSTPGPWRKVSATPTPKGREVLMAINTFPQAGRSADWHKAVDGPSTRVSTPSSWPTSACSTTPATSIPTAPAPFGAGPATSYEAINFASANSASARAVLPRVLTLAQVEHVIKNTHGEIEVFGFGSLCVMNEGRCWLSSYACGESPNTVGACSPAKYVRWGQEPGTMETRLNGILIDRFGDDEPPAIRPCARAVSRYRAKPITRWKSQPA